MKSKNTFWGYIAILVIKRRVRLHVSTLLSVFCFLHTSRSFETEQEAHCARCVSFSGMLFFYLELNTCFAFPPAYCSERNTCSLFLVRTSDESRAFSDLREQELRGRRFERGTGEICVCFVFSCSSTRNIHPVF